MKRFGLLSLLPAFASALFAGLGILPGCEPSELGEITQIIRPGSTEIVTTTAASPPASPSVPNSSTSTTLPTQGPTPASAPTSPGREIMFCFWNVENLFDDRDDNRTGPGDKEYDALFSQQPNLLRLKLDKLSEGILSLNQGKGPDILAMCEIEGIRAAQLLQATLNARLADPNLHYRNLIMKEMRSGRHIAPAILTRLPVDNNRTRTHGSRQRTLEGRLGIGKHELVVIVSHWTSRLQKEGADTRMAYANNIYGACNAMTISNPRVDFVVCGDFNDNPTDPSVLQGLRSTTNPAQLFAGGSLHLLNLFGNWTEKSGVGSLYYQGWNQFDHILVSPGMLDPQGWSCDIASARIGNYLHQPNDKLRRPWRFGGEKESGPRGYSDHFPVTARLFVQP